MPASSRTPMGPRKRGVRSSTGRASASTCVRLRRSAPHRHGCRSRKSPKSRLCATPSRALLMYVNFTRRPRRNVPPQLEKRRHVHTKAELANWDVEVKALNGELEHERRLLKEIHRQWIDTIDAFDDPLFVRDSQYRILRCNRAYAARAGLTFPEILGRRYWEIFPKASAHVAALD